MSKIQTEIIIVQVKYLQLHLKGISWSNVGILESPTKLTNTKTKTLNSNNLKIKYIFIKIIKLVNITIKACPAKIIFIYI